MCNNIVIGEVQPQDHDFSSFIGGKPKVPSDFRVPNCTFCGSEQTFFFQVMFPEHHAWSGRIMAVFNCTSCWHQDHLIPEMLSGELKNAIVPEFYLNDYQKNFFVYVFENQGIEVLETYIPKLRFAPIILENNDDSQYDGHKLGGIPDWYLENESPLKTDTGYLFTFLMQFREGVEFQKLPGAPGQLKMNYFTGEAASSNSDTYQLFLGNSLYFYGATTEEGPKVYIITQI